MTLYPRRVHGNTHGSALRRKAKAHCLLDKAAAGHEIRQRYITWALRITGDLT